MIEIGKVLKAQGIKGEIKLYCLLDDAKMLCDVKRLFVSGRQYQTDKMRFDGKFVYVLLKGVSDRNTAETFKDEIVYAEKQDLKLAKGRYYVDDLIGCVVRLQSGAQIGKVTDILQYGAADVFVCSAQKPFSFPFLKDTVVQVDIDNGIIVVDDQRFGEVVCYED